jgi:hypothetical protein
MTDAQDAVAVPAEEVSAGTNAWYLYGITGTSPELEVLAASAAGTEWDERPPQVLEMGDLAAVVRPVRLSDFSAETLADRADDPVWLEGMVRGHNDVITAVHQRQAILPAKFGSVFAGTAELRQSLDSMQEALVVQLERLEGADEWAVHVYADPSAVEGRVTAESPALQALRQEMDAAPPGRAYFLRRQVAERTAAETEAALDDLANAAYEVLAPFARDGQISGPAPAERGSDRLEILKAAFLVGRDGLDSFLDAISGLDGGDDRIAAEVSGPWPPYSFAGEHLP